MSVPDNNFPPLIRKEQMGLDPRAPLLGRESTVAKMLLELGTPTQAFGLDVACFEDSLARVLEPWAQLVQKAAENGLDAEAVIAPHRPCSGFYACANGSCRHNLPRLPWVSKPGVQRHQERV